MNTYFLLSAIVIFLIRARVTSTASTTPVEEVEAPQDIRPFPVLPASILSTPFIIPNRHEVAPSVSATSHPETDSEASTNAPSVTSSTAPSVASLVFDDNEAEHGKCTSVGCLGWFAKYYKEILLRTNSPSYLGAKKIGKYLYALRFLPARPIKISSIKQAFQTCFHYRHRTKKDCMDFLSAFHRKNYTIDKVAEYCVKFPTICNDPATSLTVSLKHEDNLDRINDLQFSDCYLIAKQSNNNILIHNLRYKELLKLERKGNPKKRNRCSCRQVHMLARMYKLIVDGAIITERTSPPEFDDLLKTFCITESTDTISKLSWDADAVLDEVGGTIKGVPRISEPVALAKVILLHEELAPKIEIGGWCMRSFVSKFLSFEVDMPYYSDAIDLIATGMLIIPTMDGFERFLTTTLKMHTDTFRQVTVQEENKPNSPFWTNLLYFRKDLMKMFVETSYFIEKDLYEKDSFFEDISEFYLDHYIPVNETT